MKTVDPEALMRAVGDARDLDNLSADCRDGHDDVRYAVQAHLDAAPEVPQDAADQLAAAGAIIAALVRQLDSYGAIVPHLPNVSPGQQSAAIRMLAAVGLDCNGRRVA